MPKFEIRNYKSQRGHEGPGFYCVLWVDGVKGAEVINEANGGMFYWTWYNKDAERKFAEHVAVQPEEPFGGAMEGTFKPDADCVIEQMVIRFETEKKARRAAKTKTIFRVKGDEEKGVAYRSLNRAYSPESVAYLKEKFGDELVEIINETLARG